MAPKRKRKPAAKSTATTLAKEAHGDISSTLEDQVVLRSGTTVSKKPILVPRRPKSGTTVAQPEPATETQPPDILPAATSPQRSPVDSNTRDCRACGTSKDCTDSNSEFPTHNTRADLDNKQAVDFERSERHIRCSMARCPRCGLEVEQNGESDDMVCPCGAHWKSVSGVQMIGGSWLADRVVFREVSSAIVPRYM